MIKRGTLRGRGYLLIDKLLPRDVQIGSAVRSNQKRGLAVHNLQTSSLSSKYGHFWLQNHAIMPASSLQNCPHKPLGDVFRSDVRMNM